MDAIEGKVVNRGDEDDDSVFNLDVWLDEAADDEKPFTFTVGDTIYSMQSPEDFDWQQQSRSAADPHQGDMRPFIGLLLGDDQYEDFCKHSIPAKGIAELVERWQEHHGITVPESRASRRASKRTTKKPRPTSKRSTR